MLLEADLHKDGRRNAEKPLTEGEGFKLADHGISYRLSSECQTIAKMPRERFDGYIARAEQVDENDNVARSPRPVCWRKRPCRRARPRLLRPKNNRRQLSRSAKPPSKSRRPSPPSKSGSLPTRLVVTHHHGNEPRRTPRNPRLNTGCPAVMMRYCKG